MSKPRWSVWYFHNGMWNRDSVFHSKKAAADYAGRVFGTSCHWEIRRNRMKAEAKK